MKLRLTILAVTVLGLGVPSIALAGGTEPPPPCVPINQWHPCHETPPPHGDPLCEEGEVVWINRYHYVCVIPPGDDCIYERITYGRRA